MQDPIGERSVLYDKASRLQQLVQNIIKVCHVAIIMKLLST